MNQAVANIERPKSVIVDMATRFGMEPAAFEQTVRATVIKNATREELAAFLLVAKEYNLNPLTKEIYAFPAKGGGIVPVVSIDGWINLINSHAASDGFEFDMDHGVDGKLVSCTCRMFRKDRSRPVTVTEYLSECIRPTEPWKMQHRMLRHKTLIQAARYAFGFSGIYDEDEGERIVANRAKEIHGEFSQVDDGGGPPNPHLLLTDPAAAAVTHTMSGGGTVVFDDGGGPPVPPSANADLDIPDYLRRTEPAEEKWLAELEAAFADCRDAATLFEANDELMQPYDGRVSAAAWDDACDMLERHIERVQTNG